MAQGQTVIPDIPGFNNSLLSSNGLSELQQYERILKLRDAILSGTHPTIKLPEGVAPSEPSPLQNLHKEKATKTPFQAAASPSAQQPVAANASARATQAPGSPGERRAYGSGSLEINPILLEKSDELIRAEFQLQRQRLERSLKEDFEQRRGTKERPEPLADQDLTDLLAKALKLVQETTNGPVPADGTLTANDEAASDSFDDGTFYSSSHDTPEPTHISPHHEPELSRSEAQPPAAVIPPTESQSRPMSSGRNVEYSSSVRGPGTSTASAPNLTNTAPAPPTFQVPGLNNYPSAGAPGGSSSQGTVSGEIGRTNKADFRDVSQGNRGAVTTQHRLDDAYVDTHPPSPLVRTHNMVPVAPQPTAAPYTAVEDRLVPAAEQYDNETRGAPAQVAALRSEPVAVHSPESSPQSGNQSGKGSDKKKGKKKKRKADRQAPEEVMPYIKPEPRSPSPMNAPSYLRPSKRRKQSQRQLAALHPDEVIHIHANDPQPYPVNAAHTQYAPSNQRAASTAATGTVVYEGDMLPNGAYIRRQASPRYVQRPVSTVYSSQPPPPVIVDDGYREPPRAYGEPYGGSRMSVHPEAERYAGQPMPPPTRIYVDSLGREYIEPARPAMRQSVAPGPHYGSEVIYEPPPPGAIPRHAAPISYNDGRGIVYARATSAYPGPRRVVTQPEYGSQEFRGREYSSRPPGPPTEYIQVQAPTERQQPQPGVNATHFGVRPASVRPMEHVRYEMPRQYERVQSVRPQAPSHEYPPTGVSHAGHNEVAQAYPGVEYGAHHVEQPIYQRGYSTRPVERYYEPQAARGGEETTYYEAQPAPPQGIVYTEDGREVYR